MARLGTSRWKYPALVRVDLRANNAALTRFENRAAESNYIE